MEDGAPFDDALQALLREDATRGDDESERPLGELTGLAELYPQLNEPLQAILAKQGQAPTVEVVLPDLSGKRVVFVGGQQWLKKRAVPLMREQWKMDVDWLEPQEAKNGAQMLGLAAGSCDLVIINTQCISHAASGRAQKEATAAGTRWKAQESRGVGSSAHVRARRIRGRACGGGEKATQSRGAQAQGALVGARARPWQPPKR